VALRGWRFGGLFGGGRRLVGAEILGLGLGRTSEAFRCDGNLENWRLGGYLRLLFG